MDAKTFYLKYKAYIWPVVTGIASIIIIALVLIPQILAYLKVQTQISEIQDRSYSLEAKAQGLEQIDATGVKKNLQTAFTVLPTQQEIPQAMAVLQELVAKSGLTLKNSAYAPAVKGAKNNYILTLTVGGDMASIRKFLIQLQDAPRVFQVESIDVQFIKGSNDIEASIPVSVYFESAPKQISKVDSPIPKLNEGEEQLLNQLNQFISSPISSSSAQFDTSFVPLGKTNPFE